MLTQIYFIRIFFIVFDSLQKAGRAAGKAVTKTPAKRKSTGSNRSRTAKKSKKDDSEESEEEPDDEEPDDDDEDYEDEDDGGSDDGGSKGNKSESKSRRSRPSVAAGKNQPDKDGNMELYLFKNDLTKEYRSDEKLCMWRRDGASLLQKYLVVREDSDGANLVFKALSVYSCWEEKRKNDFFQIKVTLVGDKKDGKVRVIDGAELEKYAQEDRPKVDLTPKGADASTENAGDDDDDGEEDDEEGEDGFDDEEE